VAGLNLDITANANDVLKELSRVRGEIGKLGDQQQQQAAKAKSFGKDLMGGLALGAAARFAVSEFDDAEKTARKMDAAIEATGNSAHVSAEEQRKLGDELGKVAAVDNDVVIAAGNRLRMYKNIKDEQFGETLAASLDIAAAKEKDLSVVTEQLGKALNNPLKAGKLLRSLGIELTAQQEQQIKAFVAAGDAAKAQGVILDEVSKRYGGAAAANATDTEKMKVAAADAAEAVGGVLAPALKVGAEGAQGLAGAFRAMPQPVQTSIVLLGAAAFAAEKASDRLGSMKSSLSANVSELGKFDTALAVAGTGLAAYGATTALLESQAKFSGDLAGLTRDLTDLGQGSIGALAGIEEITGSISGLAEAIRLGGDVSTGEALRSIFGYLDPSSNAINTSDIRKAQGQLEALDQSLAEMVKGGHSEEAEAAVGELVTALEAEGITAAQVAEILPGYYTELERGARSHKESATATKEDTSAAQQWNAAVAGNVDKAIALHQAQLDLADAHEAVATAQADLATAQQAAAGNSDEYRQATEAVTDAEKSAADAAKQVQSAREALNQAYKDAAENLDDLGRSAEGAAITEEEAAIRLADAKKKQDDLNRSHKSSARERADAAREVRKADLALRDAQDASADSAAALEKAKLDGVENAPNVVAAKEAVTQALENQRTAEGRVADASRAAAQVLVDAKAKVGEASKNLTKVQEAERAKTREVQTSIYGAKAANDAYIEGLRAQADSMAEGSPLRVNLDNYIAQLEQVQGLLNPENVPTPGGQSVVPPTRDPDAGPRRGARSLTRGGGVTVNLNVNNLHTGPGKRAVDSMAATAGAKAARAIMVATG